MIQSPSTQIIVHPIVLDFLEQTFEHIKLPNTQQRRTNVQEEETQDSDDNHLNTM